jgi:hypothetical protein
MKDRLGPIAVAARMLALAALLAANPSGAQTEAPGAVPRAFPVRIVLRRERAKLVGLASMLVTAFDQIVARCHCRLPNLSQRKLQRRFERRIQ